MLYLTDTRACLSVVSTVEVAYEKTVKEVYPETMVDGEREPNHILVRAYGVFEDSQKPVKLPYLFKPARRLTIYTHEWLAPVLYEYDRSRNVLVIRDVYPASIYNAFPVELGEKSEKTAVGVVYVNTKTVELKPGIKQHYSTIDGLPLDVQLDTVEIKVTDIAKLILKLWLELGSPSAERIDRLIAKLYLNCSSIVVPGADIGSIVKDKRGIEERLISCVSERLAEYNIKLVDLRISLTLPPETWEYYFWHTLHSIPPEYPYLIRILSKLPEEIIRNVPKVAEIIAESLLNRTRRSQQETIG